MAKIKKFATLLTAFLLCGSVLSAVACGGSGNTSNPNSHTSSSASSSEDEYIPPEPSVFQLEEHTWTGWETVTAKTCTSNGEEKLVCLDEGCGAVKTRVVKAGHTWGSWTGSTSNLCVRESTLSRVCRDCNTVETSTVAMRGHVYRDGTCEICDTPFAYPTLSANPNYVDVWDTTIQGSGGSFDRKRLSTDTYYTVDVPASDFENPDYGVWISVPVSGPGLYGLLTIGGANDTIIERFDANDHYIPGDENGFYLGHAASELDNGESFSLVNCGEAYWNSTWRATWRFSASTATSLKFVVVKIGLPEWMPESIHESARPRQLNNVTANEAPSGYTALEVDYEDAYYFDEWNGVYRRGSKSNPGEVIYMAITKEATRLFGENTFITIQEGGNNLSFSTGVDEKGNYLIRDYHSFLLASEAINGNAYEGFVNSDGLYPVTPELKEFLQLYTAKNRPLNIPTSIWDNETERDKKAWLGGCYYYCELTPGTEANPYLITTLGDFEAQTPRFDISYFTIAYRDESGAPVSNLILSCSDSNARISINGQTYVGPFEVEIEVNALTGVTFYIGAKNGAETTFTLSLSLAK